MDSIIIEILDDGTASIKTEDISEANHMSADELLFELENMIGGPRETTKREHPFFAKRTVKRGGKIVHVKGGR